MSKYAMLNCWDDLNKGDLGIMLATVEGFKRIDSECEVIGISSFNSEDPSFSDGHTLLRKFVPKIYPAIFGTLGIKIRGTYRKDIVSKLIGLVIENIRYYLCLHLPKKVAVRMLSKEEQRTLDAILECDVAFSKGGSVFTDYNSRRGSFALIRLCRLYNLLHRFGVKYYILGQSFGPVASKRGIKATNRVIDNAEKVFIRENECALKYPLLHLKNPNVAFSNDVGFLIEPKFVDSYVVNHTCINVGMTIRGEENDNSYLLAIIEMLNYLVNKGNTCVHIFKQVAMDSEPDNIATDIILKKLDADIRKRVIYHKENFLPQELCWLYGEMDYFIGTRLHSTIFSMSAGTPAIGIVYHGTKTQGVFDNIGVPELIISGEVTSEKLIDRYEYMVENRDEIVSKISCGVNKAREEMTSAIKLIVQTAKGEEG